MLRMIKELPEFSIIPVSESGVDFVIDEQATVARVQEHDDLLAACRPQ